MQNTTVIGIVVAVIIIFWGLRIILRKSNDAQPSLESPLQFNEQSQLPIIPRHVRDQLQGQGVEQNSEHDSEQTQEQQSAEPHAAELNHDAQVVAAEVPATEATAITPSTDTAIISETTVETTVEQEQTVSTVAATATAQTEEFNLNPSIEAAEIKEFEDESSILDKHLHEQQRYDDESSLANAASIIALNVYPNPRKALSGDKTLKVLLKYGLRYGELSCFHRYEESDESNTLLFSVLRITQEGPCGFDLEALSVEQVQGLAFFLALPHKDVQKGFDTMVSTASLIAREIDGAVYDENNLELTPQLKEHWRHKAIDYRTE